MAVIYGDDLANDLSGTAGADTIYGLGGDDTLTGDTGSTSLGEVSDRLYGGVGDDVYNLYRAGDGKIYTLGVASSVVEGVDQGFDIVNFHTVGALTNYHVAPNVEVLNIYGNVGIIWGDDADNIITVSGGSDFVALVGSPS